MVVVASVSLMALFVARPSRGSWIFFALIALTALGARGFNKYERSVIQRDRPLTDLTQTVAECVLGSSAPFLLAGSTRSEWEVAISRWMRVSIAAPELGDWPGRCHPNANSLAASLAARSAVNDPLTHAARQLSTMLAECESQGRGRCVARIDNNTLPRALATVLDGVRSMSLGTRETWNPTRHTTQTWRAVSPVVAPRLTEPPNYLRDLRVLSGTHVAWFDSVAGSTRVAAVAPEVLGAPRSGTLLSGGAIASSGSDGLRLEDDRHSTWAVQQEDQWLSLPMARPLEISAEVSRLQWDVARSGTSLALLTVDHGNALVRVTRSNGSEPWSAPLRIGMPESVIAAVVVGESQGWRVTALVAEFSSARVLQFMVRQNPEGLSIAAAEDAAVTRPLNLFGRRALTCASGDIRYLALVSSDGMSVSRVAGSTVSTAVPTVGFAGECMPVFTCEENRALIASAPVRREHGHFVFDFRARAPNARAVEAVVSEQTEVMTLHGIALVPDGFVALMSNPATLRAYRTDLAASEWVPAGILALVSSRPLINRTFTDFEIHTTGNQMAVMMRGQLVNLPPVVAEGVAPPVVAPAVSYVALLGSSDGGRSFWDVVNQRKTY
jgi:hypothetical protein